MKVKIGKYPKSNKKRKVKVRIDSTDLWNMDHTLALIIYPMLVRIQKAKIGLPYVEDVDVPENLRCEPDANGHIKTVQEKWAYVVDNMVFSFEQIVNGGVDDINNKELQEKINKGLELFGKYYRCLYT